MAIQEVLVSKIFNYTSEPTKKVEGQFWFNPSTNILSRYNGTTWEAITVSSDDVAVLSDGNKISLTNYLNTQIAALAEGIDSKQDKLSSYKESNGNTTINTNGNIILRSYNDNEQNLEYTEVAVDGRNISINANNQNIIETSNILTIGVNDSGVSDVKVTSLSGKLVTTSINSNDTQLPTSKAVKTELDKKQNSTDNNLKTTSKTVSGAINEIATALDKKQNNLSYYYEGVSTDQTASIQGAKSFSILNTSNGLIIDGNDGGITIKNNNINAGQGIISINGNSWRNNSDPILFDINGDDTIKISDALLIPEIKNKQNSSDTSLETSAKTIVGAINEINSIFNVNALPTPITDVKTITTTLENLITDTQYANKPGTILINPNIKNTGAILVGEAITDISKAFPIYTDQPVTIAFKNINDFKVAGENAGESFNYIISFGYINQSISTNA